jgi:hypothetical protein
MISTATLKMVVDRLEQLMLCDELNRTERDHLSWALAHLREVGRESEEGTGRSAGRLQDDLWEEARRFADRGLAQAWVASGLSEREKKGVAA